MNKKPLISIIIPTYNRADLINETLDSIKAQTYTNWECIVVDDGSTDNTAKVLVDVIKKDSRFRFYKRPENRLKGPNTCRNIGFDKSTGLYVNFFDSDDLYNPAALATYVSLLKDNLDAVVAKVEQIDFHLKTKTTESIILSENIIEDYLTGKISYYICGPMWKRTFLNEQEYLFDDTIRNMDDWDFNLRMLYKKPRLRYHNAPLIQYRIHENSLYHELKALQKEEIMSDISARYKHLKILKELDPKNYKVLEKFIAKRYLRFLRRALKTNHALKYDLLKKSICFKLRTFDVVGLLKICIGFVLYTSFNRGFNLMR